MLHLNRLSPKELKILQLMAKDGLSNLEVARLLNLSPNTISTHMQRIVRKFQARHPRHALALYWNWCEPGEREFKSWMQQGGKA